MKASRLFRTDRPLRGDTGVTRQQPIDEAAWIWRAGCDNWGGAKFTDTRTTPEALGRAPQCFLRFRNDFVSHGGSGALELDVSADERFILLLDGEEIGRGPNRGLPNRWHCHAYRIEGLGAGHHRLEAVCWQIGEHAPLAQLSIRGGFILKASGDFDAALTTGKAPWRVATLHGTRMTDKGNSGTFGVGSQCEVSGTSIIDEEPPPEAWEDATAVRGPVDTFAGLRMQGWLAFPTPLPDMMRERMAPGAIRRGPDLIHASPACPASIPPHSTVESYWDLGGYFCAYPELRVSGGAGAKIRWGWAECLVGPDGQKRDRAEIDGKSMDKAMEDTFLPDGRGNARFTTPWWRCGRWCRITVETADAPISIESAAIVETRLPASLQAKFDWDEDIQRACERSLQMCMHEMFFDCPYYEQQMYPGDSRVQYLVATLFGEMGRRAAKNAIALYDADRRENGMMPMNCPTRGTQESFTFTCCQAMMLGDLAWNHDDQATLRARLPGLAHTLLGMEAFALPNGLVAGTPGWNFIDWEPEWKGGVPPDADSGRPNAEVNLEYLHALISGIRTAEALGEPELAAFWRGRADRLRDAIRSAFWCPEQALFASDTAHSTPRRLPCSPTSSPKTKPRAASTPLRHPPATRSSPPSRPRTRPPPPHRSPRTRLRHPAPPPAPAALATPRGCAGPQSTSATTSSRRSSSSTGPTSSSPAWTSGANASGCTAPLSLKSPTRIRGVTATAGARTRSGTCTPASPGSAATRPSTHGSWSNRSQARCPPSAPAPRPHMATSSSTSPSTMAAHAAPSPCPDSSRAHFAGRDETPAYPRAKTGLASAPETRRPARIRAGRSAWLCSLSHSPGFVSSSSGTSPRCLSLKPDALYSA